MPQTSYFFLLLTALLLYPLTADEPQTILEQRNSRRKLHPDFFQLDNLSPPRSSCHVSRCSDRERRNRRVVNEDEVIMPEVSGI